jgi:hypothetical protein
VLGFFAIGVAGVANAAPTLPTAPGVVQHAQLTGWGGPGWHGPGGGGWRGPGWGGGGFPPGLGWTWLRMVGRPATASSVPDRPLHLSLR